jgi:GlpG protein
VTSVFVHLEIWHVAFNCYWLWQMGSHLERAVGWKMWLGFFIAAAVLSSGAQLVFTGDMGIGMSGVLYAMFGLMWFTRDRFLQFNAVLDNRTVALLLVWMVGCILLTFAGAVTVGNTAHVTGLLFGIAVAKLYPFPEEEEWEEDGEMSDPAEAEQRA